VPHPYLSEETMKDHDNRPPGRESNPRPLEYEAMVTNEGATLYEYGMAD